MKTILNRIAIVLEDIAWVLIEIAAWLRDKTRTPDLSMPWYPEGPEDDE